MPRQKPPFDLHISPQARRDIGAILEWSEREFGKKAAVRYEALLVQALRDLCADPERPGSMERPEILADGVRSYHLEFSRARVKGQTVKSPRHFLLYRRRDDHVIEVGRVIHDARDLTSQLPEEYRRSAPPAG